MALTRKLLSALGIEADKVEEIINAHTEVTDALKAERDKYKADAQQLEAVTKERDELKARLDDDGAGEDSLAKLQKEYDEFKASVEKREETRKLTAAFRALAQKAGIPDRRLDAVIRLTDMNNYKLDKDGNLEDADKITESIKNDWSDYIPTSGQQGAEVANPPANNGGSTMTREQIRSISDPIKRQKAMLENSELFGLNLTKGN